MFEKTERGDANSRTLAPLEQAPRDTSPEADCELLRLCDEFRRAHARWVEYFNSLADNMADQEPAMGELARLRSVWRKALDRLRELPPVTPSGALAKQDLAYMLKAWGRRCLRVPRIGQPRNLRGSLLFRAQAFSSDQRASERL
jgi:hypothetical protein